MIEIWKDIEGYEGLYQISSLGRVKSLDRYDYIGRFFRGKTLKPIIHNNGYAFISLSKNGESECKSIHRIVAKHFLPNHNNLPEVNHKDEDKTNNMVWVNEDGSIDYVKSNLEWCDREYNCNYGTRNEKGAKTRFNYPSISKPVLALKNGKICMCFKSTMQAQRHGFNNSKISGCCNGKGKTHMGYEWMFLEDYLADWWDKEMDTYMEKEKAA